ncbi:hypothetical protein ACSBR1_038903 [Camellia fascicularis]
MTLNHLKFFKRLKINNLEMGYPQAPPNSPHLYPQTIQLRLYQAFIFSIPILFSIILLLLFYLFYLKRRASLGSSQPTLPRTTLNHALFPSSSEMGLKGNLKDNLPIILVDEDLTSRDSTCCVCLGEFEIKEEVHQIPTCKHVFHIDCIGYWLHSNPTCPLCRCIIITTTITATKWGHLQPPVGPNLVSQDNQNFNNNPHMVHDLEQQEQLVMANNNLGEHHMLVMERII